MNRLGQTCFSRVDSSRAELAPEPLLGQDIKPPDWPPYRKMKSGNQGLNWAGVRRSDLATPARNTMPAGGDGVVVFLVKSKPLKLH